MAMAKFEVEKFDGQNSFSLWRIKMKALLRQQGLSKVLEVSISEDSPAPSKEEEEKVNNAGIIGAIIDGDALAVLGVGKEDVKVNWSTETNELAEECLKTNYHGAKRMIEALLPLLQLSNSPRIVNVSSSIGQLKHIPNERARGVFGEIESLTEESLDEVLSEFLKDFQEGDLENKGWPVDLSSYTVSKAALNAYTRIVAKKYPSFRVNCACPGYVKTDLNHNVGYLTIEEGAEGPVRLALLPDNGPTGMFFSRNDVITFD